MSCIGTSGTFDCSLSLFMMETCAPVSSNNFGGLLLTIKLTVHFSLPTLQQLWYHLLIKL